MKNYILALLMVVTTAFYVSPTVSAYYIRPVAPQTPMNHVLTCGIKTCRMSVNLKLPFESFAPAEVLWQHKVNNATYSTPTKASTTYVFYIQKQAQVVTVKAESYGMTFVKSFDIKL